MGALARTLPHRASTEATTGGVVGRLRYTQVMNEPDKTDAPKGPDFRLSDYSPNTHMILGAVLSGGDPLKLAQMLVDAQKNSPGDPDV